MKRFWAFGLAGLLSVTAMAAEDSGVAPPAQAPATPAGLQNALDRLRQALAAQQALALLPVELNGTDQGAPLLEQALLQALQAEGRRLVDPRQAFLKLGVEFQLSEAALAQAADLLDVEAVVFPRVFATPQTVELHLWVVSRQGKTLFEETFPIEMPAPPAEDTTGPPTGKTAAGAPPVPAENDQEPAARRVPLLALAPRIRGEPGVSVGLATGHMAIGVHTPPQAGEDWMITEDGQPISEARLAELAGRQEILRRMEKAAGRFRTWRNVGIGLTIAGFIATAVALPYYKQGEEQGLTAASVAVAGGTVLGATGLILWINYAGLATSAYSPYPSRHFISVDEAQEMIEEVNRRRRKEIAPELSGGEARLFFGFSPLPGTWGATVGGVF